ncbi:MAG: hypothetical protein WAT79_01865 [Saprospiraceae bacterium]
MFRVFILILGLFLANSNQTSTFTPVKKIIKLGENEVSLLIYTKPGELIAYAHVHENETSSLEAGLHIWNKYGGKIITIDHSKDSTKNRNITFNWKKTVYEFDPNRIYTSDLELLKFNIKVIKGKGVVDDFIIKEVKKLADAIWAEVADFPFILALHNNKNEAGALVRKNWFCYTYQPESYSINSYVKRFDQTSGSNLSCEDIYINPNINNSEFFIVTQRRDFSVLSKKRYNVVLQNDHPVDDGSMSVFAHKNKIRYINSEAKMGRTKEQIDMLQLLFD